VLGLGLDKIRLENISVQIIDMLKQMDEARANKNYKEADKLRSQIEKEGYKVLNAKDGSKVEKI